MNAVRTRSELISILLAGKQKLECSKQRHKEVVTWDELTGEIVDFLKVNGKIYYVEQTLIQSPKYTGVGISVYGQSEDKAGMVGVMRGGNQFEIDNINNDYKGKLMQRAITQLELNGFAHHISVIRGWFEKKDFSSTAAADFRACGFDVRGVRYTAVSIKKQLPTHPLGELKDRELITNYPYKDGLYSCRVRLSENKVRIELRGNDLLAAGIQLSFANDKAIMKVEVVSPEFTTKECIYWLTVQCIIEAINRSQNSIEFSAAASGCDLKSFQSFRSVLIELGAVQENQLTLLDLTL